MGENKRPKVLVADDEEINREVVSAMLEILECDADIVDDGHKALDLAARERYDLILLDVRMPAPDGFAVCAEIRERESESGPLTPVVAMTGLVSGSDKDECLAAGMDDVLEKPLSLASLQSVVDSMCG